MPTSASVSASTSVSSKPRAQAEHATLLASYFGGVLVYGVADGLLETMQSTLLSTYFALDPSPAFSNLRFWQSSGFAVAMFYGPYVASWLKLVGITALLLFSAACAVQLPEQPQQRQQLQ